MKKRTVNLQTKNSNPEVYGYQFPWDIPGNTREHITVFFLEFEDADGDVRYCPCSKEIYEWDRNEKSKEFKRYDRFTRCFIQSKTGKSLVKCRYKCEECPFGFKERQFKIISSDGLYDDYEFELSNNNDEVFEAADEDSLSPLDALIKEERISEMYRLISLLNETDQLIIKLFSEGFNDTDIAKKLNKKRTTVVSRRKKLFDDLREQLKDF